MPVIFFIIAAVLAVLTFFVTLARKEDFFDALSVACRVAIFGAVFALLFAIAIGSLTYSANPCEIREEENLVAFNDASTIEGTFFLRIGTPDGTFSYVYYYEDDAGGIRLGTVAADDAVVREETREGATKQTLRCGENAVRFWGFSSSTTRYEFHVPKGTVQRQFILDLK